MSLPLNCSGLERLTVYIRSLCVFSFLLLATTLFSQSDFRSAYVITLESDTIYGYIDFRGEVRNMRVCAFKASLDGVVKEYFPGEITGYRFVDDGKFFISKEVHTDWVNGTVFVEFLFKGIANLYFYRNLLQSAYFIEKDDGELIELNEENREVKQGSRRFSHRNKRYIGLLNYTFQESPELQNDIRKTTLSHRSLVNVTRKYHEIVCPDDDCIVFEAKIPTFKVRFAPFVDMSMTYLKISKYHSLDGFDFDPSIRPGIGLGLEIAMPRLNEKLSVCLSGQYKEDYLYGTREIISPYHTEKNFVHLYTQNIYSKLGLKYTYPTGRVRPEVIAGFYHYYLLNRDTEGSKDFVYRGVVTSNSVEVEYFGINHGGFYIGAGVTGKLFYNIDAFANVYGQYGRNFSVDKIFTKVEMTTFGLSIGLKL